MFPSLIKHTAQIQEEKFDIIQGRRRRRRRTDISSPTTTITATVNTSVTASTPTSTGTCFWMTIIPSISLDCIDNRDSQFVWDIDFKLRGWVKIGVADVFSSSPTLDEQG